MCMVRSGRASAPLRKGVEHGLAPDWPISYEEIAPYYEWADRIIGVSELEGDRAMPAQEPPVTPPLPMGRAARRLAAAFDRLGWHWWPVPAGVISQDYDGRPACNGCGVCNGCPRGSMSKFSISVWPKALEAGVELRTYARVIRIETGSDGRATGAIYVDRTTGAHHRQTADVVIVAANGVGTPRLLLASDNLANSSDQVGRNLLHHTLVSMDFWVDEPLASHTGYVGSLVGREFAETDVNRGFVNGFAFNCLTSGAAGEQAAGYVSETRAPWGRAYHACSEVISGTASASMRSATICPIPTTASRSQPCAVTRTGSRSRNFITSLAQTTGS